MRTALWLVFGLSAVLVLGAAPSISVLDSAELAGAAARLGLSHPPGQATHALLAKAAMLLPLGDLGFRTNLVSVLGASLAGMLVAIGARRLGAPALGAVAAAVAVTLGGVVVENATRAEVYTPAMSLAALSIVLAQTGRGLRDAAGAGLSAGLAWTLHPAAGIAAGLGQLAASGGSAALGRRARALGAFALGAVAGLTPLAYVLVRGPRDPWPIWDTPGTLAAALAYFRGAGYAGNFALGNPLEGLAGAGWLVMRATGFVLPLATVGLALAGRDRRALLLLGACVLALAPVAPLPMILENADFWGYMCGALVLLGLAYGQVSGRAPAWLGALVLVTALALGGGARHLRPHAHMGQALVESSLDALPPRAVLIADSDHVTGALAYLPMAEGARPDVTWIASGLAGQRAPWARVKAHDTSLAGQPRLAPVPGDVRDRMMIALMAAARRRVPVAVENPRLLRGPPAAERAGLFLVSGQAAACGPLWRRIAREHRGDPTEEGIVRGAMLVLAGGLARRGEASGAARALLAGLARPDPLALEVARALPGQAELGQDPPDVVLRETFDPTPEALERALARLAWRAGRGADAVRLLERAYARGSLEAAGQLAVLTWLDGRQEAARSMARTIITRDPSAKEPLERALRRVGALELGGD